MSNTPFDQIKENLSRLLPEDLITKIPDKWEKIGDVVIIKLSSSLENYSQIIGEKYAEVLNCKTILNDVGGIIGPFREPRIKIIFGPENTETVHKENNISFKLDPQKIMFSSGNMDERIRMSDISNGNETVVDLFAGIGYFTLPIAVFSRPIKIFSCEINPVSYNYLCENIVLNKVTDIVEPLIGDCREFAPKNVADRVLLGYIGGTKRYLSTAFDCLKEGFGVIHYHDKYSDSKIPDKPIKEVESIAKKCNCSVRLLSYRKVKSYAPGVGHYVFDIKIGKL